MEYVKRKCMSKYEKAKHRKRKVILSQILAIFFLGIIIAILTYHLYQWHLSNQNKAIYERANETEKIMPSEEKTANMKKIEKLRKENSEVVGWIQINGTTINYPILQTNNNKYYLTHNYQKKESKYGSIFLKTECNLKNNNSNLIIYGHHMEDKQMFYPLVNYIDKKYYEEHKTIQIATLEEECTYTIMSVFKSRVFYQDEKDVFRYYNYTDLKDKNKYNEFIQNCKKIELYDTGIVAKYGDRIITLITCEYSQKNGRIVVVAKKEMK